MRNLSDIYVNANTPPSNSSNKELFLQTVRDNTVVLHQDNNWNLLPYKEAYYIKRLSPSLNKGLKATRELSLE